MVASQLAYSVSASAGHDLAGHFECAKRIPVVLEALQQNQLTAEAQPQKVRAHILSTFHACSSVDSYAASEGNIHLHACESQMACLRGMCMTALADETQMRKVQGRAASTAQLELVHSSAHVANMKRKATEDAPCVVADFEETPDNTTYMSQSSFDDALQVRILSDSEFP